MNIQEYAMANYENGLDTKEKILHAAQCLFYEKGYDATTFKDISGYAKVNQGLIVYHYKTKARLANAIFREFIKASMGSIEEYFAGADMLTQYFIGDYLYFRLLYENEPFRNFMDTCCDNGLLKRKEDTIKDDVYLKYYWALADCITEDAGPDGIMLEGLLTVYDGLKDNYTCYICHNFHRFSMREAAETYIFIYCRLFGISEEHYGKKMMEAQILANQVEIEFQNFEYRLHKRK